MPSPATHFQSMILCDEINDLQHRQKNYLRHIFSGLETIYRQLEIIDFILYDVFSDAVNGLRHQLGPNINEDISSLDEEVNASYFLMSVASKLIADFCNRHFLAMLKYLTFTAS